MYEHAATSWSYFARARAAALPDAVPGLAGDEPPRGAADRRLAALGVADLLPGLPWGEDKCWRGYEDVVRWQQRRENSVAEPHRDRTFSFGSSSMLGTEGGAPRRWPRRTGVVAMQCRSELRFVLRVVLGLGLG